MNKVVGIIIGVTAALSPLICLILYLIKLFGGE